jgi:hypothetical protein
MSAFDRGGHKQQDKRAFYTEVQISPCVNDPKRLVFVADQSAPAAPEDFVAMRRSFERTAQLVATMFEDERETRATIFELLHRAADRGLRGPDYNLDDGRENLLEVQAEVADRAHRIRDKRLREYTRLLVLFGIVPLGLGAAVYRTGLGGLFTLPSQGQPFDPMFAWAVAILWIPAGAAVCVWGEFALRMQSDLSYERLPMMDPGRWRPGQRLLITVGISFIFAYLLSLNMLQVGLGGTLLNDFVVKTPAMALAIGGITGLAFPSVQEIIYRIQPTSR